MRYLSGDVSATVIIAVRIPEGGRLPGSPRR